MFKKKYVLPPRPQVPSQEEMIADIVGMAKDDPVLLASSSKTMKESDASETAYQKLTKFLELDDNLIEAVNDLKATCESSTASGKEVAALADALQEQSTQAKSLA